eukprot:6178373-Pleurochrysis_carterae.AAC.2
MGRAHTDSGQADGPRLSLRCAALASNAFGKSSASSTPEAQRAEHASFHVVFRHARDPSLRARVSSRLLLSSNHSKAHLQRVAALTARSLSALRQGVGLLVGPPFRGRARAARAHDDDAVGTGELAHE